MGDHQPPAVQDHVRRRLLKQPAKPASHRTPFPSRQRLQLPHGAFEAVLQHDLVARQPAIQLAAVVSGHIKGGARPHHGLHQQDGLDAVGTAVRQVPQKHGLATLRMGQNGAPAPVAQPLQEFRQFQKAAVHVADDVKGAGFRTLNGQRHPAHGSAVRRQVLIGQHIDVVKGLLAQAGQQLLQLAYVMNDDALGHPAGAAGVLAQARFQGRGQHHEGGGQFVAPG